MVDDSMLHSIEKVSKKAARTWLEFGMQRCRLVINMQDIANAGESDGVGGESFVEFVLKPQLKRIGDSEGELFDKVEVVAGCEGEVNRISYGEMVMG
ncbi:hypothetical protein BU26DRAFT_517110 [Trematosphaeria pertusa]|uniref:Uncharacterized protein n=1 Tax=Trematosphaeria pertusa TaxID=390896 RepID=A0A6A6IPN4_9PLEO|nr:uncharacterized protein BU26DRAFT_517110 [Trematosphaeria pertusa]KAF2252504.1 hypothetical protein BU26DRAFT_517110 [Trematosphaeria pertusa]